MIYYSVLDDDVGIVVANNHALSKIKTQHKVQLTKRGIFFGGIRIPSIGLELRAITDRAILSHDQFVCSDIQDSIKAEWLEEIKCQEK